MTEFQKRHLIKQITSVSLTFNPPSRKRKEKKRKEKQPPKNLTRITLMSLLGTLISTGKWAHKT